MTLTEAAILNAISNEQSLDLFKAIAQTNVNSDYPYKKRQTYSQAVLFKNVSYDKSWINTKKKWKVLSNFVR